MAGKKKSKTFNWFNSTIMVLIILFIITLPMAIIRLGWDTVVNQLLLWTLGSVFVAIILYVVKKLFKIK